MRDSLKPLFSIYWLSRYVFFLARNILGQENGGAQKFIVYGICLYCLAVITVEKRVTPDFGRSYPQAPATYVSPGRGCSQAKHGKELSHILVDAPVLLPS
ncbi:MAG: hypothetical protein M0Z32_04020 [Actinomycetota bacterium]|jgi:hypothetical protein|nr:hypothetical protein [Actinomycetota bacterium]MCL6093611.1 hypothetical protein [Actinomycetota bacterium]MDA8166906.1 hypothetical protein [Actinomycetota bacterium]